jgi:ribose transport system permease protein
MAGLAGAILGSKLGASAGDPASALLLPAFAAAFLGATTLTPGRFNVWGTVVAVYFLAVTISGLQQLGAAPWVEPTFNGVALIVAVASSGLAFRTRAARARKEQLQLISNTRADAAASDA